MRLETELSILVLLWDSTVVSCGLSRRRHCWGQGPVHHPAPEPLPTEPPGRRGGRSLCLLAWTVTQMEMGASEWGNVACQIKLGVSELKIRIYFNQLGCSEGDEREGR